MKIEIVAGPAASFQPLPITAAELSRDWPVPVAYFTAFWIAPECGLALHEFIADGDRRRWRQIGESMAFTIGRERTALLVLPELIDPGRDDRALDRLSQPLLDIIAAARPEAVCMSAADIGLDQAARTATALRLAMLSRHLASHTAMPDGVPPPRFIETLRTIDAGTALGRTMLRNVCWQRLRPIIGRLYRTNGIVEDDGAERSYMALFRDSGMTLLPHAPDAVVRKLAAALFERRHGLDLMDSLDAAR